MKISTAIRNAWRAYTADLGGTVKYLLAEACLTLICLCPLLFLSQASLAPLAWGSLALWIFVMLPARMDAAEGMRRGLNGGALCGGWLISLDNYGGKLACGLKRALFLILWALPVIVLAVEAKLHFSGDVDSFTVLRMVKNDLGGGDQMRGILVLVGMVAASLLILMIGCAFHSGARHAFVQGEKALVKGHHGKVILTWLASLLSILPMLIALVIAVLRYVPALSDLNGLIMKTVTLPSTRGTILLLAAGAVLTLPLLPLRSLIHAAYVDGLAKKA